MYLLDAHDFRRRTSSEKVTLNQAVQMWISAVGILSLSKTPTDALLWSHYSDGHRGLCLGFESSRLDLKGLIMQGEVEYRESPLYVELFLEMAEELGKFVRPWDEHRYPDEQGDAFYTSQIHRLARTNLLVKSHKWAYEQEYRFVSATTGMHGVSTEALVEVICGLKMSKSDRQTLKRLMELPCYRHVTIKKVRHRSGSFDFDLGPLGPLSGIDRGD